MKRNTYLVTAIILFSFILIGGLILYVTFDSRHYRNYKNQDLGLEFDYPKNWEIEEKKNCHEFAQYTHDCVSLGNEAKLRIIVEENVDNKTNQDFGGVFTSKEDLEEFYELDNENISILRRKSITQNEFNGEYLDVYLFGKHQDNGDFLHSQFYAKGDKLYIFILEAESEIKDTNDIEDIEEIDNIVKEIIGNMK